jgi:tetratricopeptide (TPR) repeat protein
LRWFWVDNHPLTEPLELIAAVMDPDLEQMEGKWPLESSEAHITRAHLDHEVGKENEAMHWLERASIILKKLEDEYAKPLEAEIDYLFASIGSKDGAVDMTELYHRLNRAAEYFESTGDRLNWARCLAHMGGILHDRGEKNDAEKHLLKSLPVFEEEGDNRWKTMVEADLAMIHGGWNNYEQGKNLLDTLIPLFMRSDDEKNLLTALNNRGWLNLKARNFDAAAKDYEETSSLARKKGDIRFLILGLSGQAEAEAQSGKHELALELSREAVETADDQKDNYFRGIALKAEGTALFFAEKREEAENASMASLPFLEHSNLEEECRDVKNILQKIKTFK